MKIYFIGFFFGFFFSGIYAQNKNIIIVIQDSKCCDYTEFTIVICDTSKINKCLSYKDSIYLNFVSHKNNLSEFSVIYHLDSSLIQDSIYNKFLMIPLKTQSDSLKMYQKVTTYANIRIFNCNTQVNEIMPNLIYCELLFDIIDSAIINDELSERLKKWIRLKKY